ncbi:MAG: B12-binding domain-containing radical SAM protein [Halobacteriovoraceae bacterium]|jgi:anaerobic magnesium-protoporphyrin IX monomethyl ester cyclase|nr:B12-binding domain-containing radical SAM protein [Halobacteriovoraceae bacterium]
MSEILLIYPKLGSQDSMIMDPPLSLVYTAAECIKNKVDVSVIDLRAERDHFKVVEEAITSNTALVGISVMTGNPLKCAREVSRYIKKNHPHIEIVFGGPHPTVCPETIEENYVDYLVRGYGSLALYQLFRNLGTKNFNNIKGLSYKVKGKFVHNTRSDSHEIIPYQDLPYNLLDMHSPKYVRNFNKKRIFAMFSSIGCPYRCSFCVSPATFNEINGAKWIAYDAEAVVDHIKYAVETFDAKHIVFIDDTSFRHLKHMEKVFNLLVEADLGVTLEFRGCRVNEIKLMNHAFLDLMERAGGRVIMVGVESGSDRALKKMQKGISFDLVVEQNKKLAQHPKIKCHFNFIYGMPEETYEDLLESKRLAVTLIKDNPNAYFGFGGDWKPIPGTKALDRAMEYPDFVVPRTVDDWIAMDSSDANKKIVHPWYTKKHNNLIKVMQVTSFVLDKKIIKETKNNKLPFFRVIRFLARVYRPLALFRIKFNFNSFLFDYELFALSLRLIGKYGDKKRELFNDGKDNDVEKCA